MSYNEGSRNSRGPSLNQGLSSTVSIRRTIGGVNRCIVCDSVVCVSRGGPHREAAEPDHLGSTSAHKYASEVSTSLRACRVPKLTIHIPDSHPSPGFAVTSSKLCNGRESLRLASMLLCERALTHTMYYPDLPLVLRWYIAGRVVGWDARETG